MQLVFFFQHSHTELPYTESLYTIQIKEGTNEDVHAIVSGSAKTEFSHRRT
jgi:hypothetical protein